jgi:hypothetical protein
VAVSLPRLVSVTRRCLTRFATDTRLNLPSDLYGWTLVRDPLLTVPLAGNPAFEALKREIDPPN